ncbi:major facilitator superfamily domain-containing protein [Kockovaella imperatae]|uniref:Major facilitator superfamily domain-containing protein n=1 Tax=Kockovaella imperatae TaxID=4999 RepID=A0A1Y1U9V9_9TREE|nr:major facilitator superfamily domain-containing protein [Kockovaella imperatae]ORX34296.1 major facilitator superfamily domain-containing protein [Kockovaella imperatae]
MLERPTPICDEEKSLPALPACSSGDLTFTAVGSLSSRQVLFSNAALHVQIPQLNAKTLEADLARPFTNRFAPRSSPPSVTPGESQSKPYNGSGTQDDPFIVDWLPDESANPYNWNRRFKWGLTLHLALNCLAPVYTSSAYVAGVEDLVVAFPGTSVESGISGLSLYLLGEPFGPLLWAPVSEVHFIGRRKTYLLTFPFFVLFNLGGALSHNMPSILITRFFAGVFGSCQLSNLAGQVGDIWIPQERVLPAGLAALSPLLGPVLGPCVGGFVAQYSGWRAIFWMQFGFGLSMLMLWIFLVPETYGPTLIYRKTRLLQFESDHLGNRFIFRSKFDAKGKTIFRALKEGLTRPFILLFSEVIVFTLSLYTFSRSLYLLFTAFPIVFQQLRHWSLGLNGCALLGIGVGMVIGYILNGVGKAIYIKAMAKLPKGQLPPAEIRLPTMILGGLLVPIGLFIFAWTATPNVHWAVPVVFSSFFGMGYLLIFTSILLYLIDSYALHAASAVAANSVMRCLFGAAFPLFATRMFDRLGVHWAGSLLALLSLACIPLPFLFYRYGPYLRRKSKYTPSAPLSPLPPKETANEAGADKPDIVGKTTELQNTLSRLEGKDGRKRARSFDVSRLLRTQRTSSVDPILRDSSATLLDLRESVISDVAPVITDDLWSRPDLNLSVPYLDGRPLASGDVTPSQGDRNTRIPRLA